MINLPKCSILLIICTLLSFSAEAQYFELDTNFSSPNRDSRSANWVDINQDGLLDIFITNGKSGGQNNEAYINIGNGSFVGLISNPIVLDNSSSDGASWADTDGIPGLELFVANWYNQNNLYYRDTNQSGRVSISNAHPTANASYSETGAFGDYDQDGFVDLIVTNSAVNKRNDLFHNNGNGTFSRVTNSPIYQAFTTSRGVSWTDVDNDGDLDVYITNENNEKNELYINNAGQFTANTSSAITQFNASSMSSCWGDYDNDGDLDVFISNHGANNKLFRNDGNLSFMEITSSPVVTDGGFSFSANWGDIDNDGDLDLVVGNAFSANNSRLNNFLYLNDGNGGFTKNTTDTVAQHMGWTFGNAFGDYDKDGDLDLLNANCYNTTQANQLFNNLSSQEVSPNAWVVISAVGSSSNLSAIGAKIKIKATISGQSVHQMREISSQSSYCGQNMLAAHFGLGDAANIDSISIIWTNGMVEHYTNLSPNQYITLTEGLGLSTSLIDSDEFIKDFNIYPNPSRTYIELEIALQSTAVIEINLIDIRGRNIIQLENDLKVPSTGLRKKIDLPSELSEGIYLLQISNGTDKIVKKLIVEP